jgi:C4-dicarboxylate-specific signal transduction histidine kinase
MSADFIKTRLFKPFDTTKGNAGMGIGVYEAKQFIESIGGMMKVTSFENKGTIFNLSIPTIITEQTMKEII